MRRHVSHGFTLIELLVVVTIIVVLLALLVPAMDRAIYQAELAVCAARLKAHATSATLYAMDSKRYYLYRAGVMDANNAGGNGWASGNPAFLPFYLALTGPNSPTHDDRPGLRPYMAINKLMGCPFVKEVEFDNAEKNATGVKTVILYTSYTYYYGFEFAGNRGMRRLGDQLQWNDGVETRSYNVLACDTDTIDIPSGPWVLGAHPETRDPILFLRTTYGNEFLNPFVQSYETSSFWGNWGATNRGPVDRNFAYADGSVGRIDDLALDKNEWDDLERDDKRVDIVPAYTPQPMSEISRYHTWLPRR